MGSGWVDGTACFLKRGSNRATQGLQKGGFFGYFLLKKVTFTFFYLA